MPLYDFFAPAYDPAFERIYRPFRVRALANLKIQPGACVLEIGCGSGQNFPLLASRVGRQGHLIGVDISTGMLRCARNRVRFCADDPKISLIHHNAATLSTTLLEAATGTALVDFILCTYGFTSMREPEAAFRASWDLLKPGGGYGILDIYAPRRTLHARAVELATRSRFTEEAWRPLRDASPDFRMDYLDPSAHLFGGRLFVAWGTKPHAATPRPPCPS